MDFLFLKICLPLNLKITTPKLNLTFLSSQTRFLSTNKTLKIFTYHFCWKAVLIEERSQEHIAWYE